MTLEEKGITYQVIEENLSALSPELLALHPEGKVPLLVHHTNGVKHVLYQSSIITEYLNEVFPQVPLMPDGAVERAQARLWTYWCDQLFKPDLDLYKYEFSQLGESERGLLKQRLSALLKHWDETLQNQPYLLGASLTLADIHLFPFARQFAAINPAFPGLETYQAWNFWLKRIVERDSFARVMKKI